ncbi:hypothetical protein BH10PSE14_BH10PSE14_39700 [soil metagenome]
MRRADEFTTMRAWAQSLRIMVLCLLFLSAARFLATALVFRALGHSEADKLVFAGCLVLAALAAGLGLAFRKAGAPTWKHKVAVAIVALPAALSLALR